MFEVILISIGIVILSSIILLTIFNHKTHLIELLILLVVSVLFSIIFRYFSIDGLTKDSEYWSTRFEKIEYYEPWDEYIHETCTENYVCGTDSKGNTTYCTRTYDCSYVERHPSRYVKEDHLGNTYSASESEYLRLKNKMGNSSFVDLRRNYHSYDGDMYYTTYNNKLEDYECITSTHNYENKTQAVSNVFQYEDIDSLDIATFKLYDYPRVDGEKYYQPSLIGYDDPISEHTLQVINGELGNTKQVKVFVLVFRDMPITSANKQQSYWKGGNKNEVVVVINLDNNDKPTWCVPFSWSDKEEFKINIRNYVMSQDTINMRETVSYIGDQVDSRYVRKEFADFDYLEVGMTSKQTTWLLISNVILNIIASIIIVHNNLDDSFNRYERNSYNRIRRNFR